MRNYLGVASRFIFSAGRGLFWRGGPVRALLCDMLFKKALQHCMANALRAEINGFFLEQNRRGVAKPQTFPPGA